MAVVQLADIVEPQVFTDYVVQNTMARNALVAAGVASRNGEIEAQLRAGAHSFSVPNWFDLGDDEANIVNDNPADTSTPYKLGTGKQLVRKSFLHNSWSAMNLASEIAGSDAIKRIQDRAAAYWSRQLQKRLVASLQGVYADNVANDASDMVHDIAGATNADIAAGTLFSATAVIDAAAELGDNLEAISAIAMHSDVYRAALKADMIATLQDSQGRPFKTFRGLAVVVDDGLPYTPAAGALSTDAAPRYTTVLFGAGAVGYGVTAPAIAEGTEVEKIPSAGNGGGQQVLHSRVNVGVHPAGYSWVETAVTSESPSLAELRTATNWNRVYERKAIPMAFLVTNG